MSPHYNLHLSHMLSVHYSLMLSLTIWFLIDYDLPLFSNLSIWTSYDYSSMIIYDLDLFPLCCEEKINIMKVDLFWILVHHFLFCLLGIDNYYLEMEFLHVTSRKRCNLHHKHHFWNWQHLTLWTFLGLNIVEFLEMTLHNHFNLLVL